MKQLADGASVAGQRTASDGSCLEDTLNAMGRVAERKFGILAGELTMDRKLETLGFDSLAFVEYAFELEGELGVSLPDIPRELQTVGDLARFLDGEVVRQHASQRPG